MYKITADTTEAERKLAQMLGQLDDFAPKMVHQVNEWQLQELHRDMPETEQAGTKTVQVRKRGRGSHRHRAYRRLGRQLGRRVARRLLPRPFRAARGRLRRYIRIGRAPITRGLLPAPIRRVRRFARQFQRVAGAPTPSGALRRVPRVRRFIRISRRAQLNARLWETLVRDMTGLARKNLTWRR